MGHDSPIYCQKRSGAYFTPGEVARALVSWVVKGADDRLLDPSCGDGQFLAIHRNAVGIEQNPQSAQAAITAAPWALVHERFVVSAPDLSRVTRRLEWDVASPGLALAGIDYAPQTSA